MIAIEPQWTADLLYVFCAEGAVVKDTQFHQVFDRDPSFWVMLMPIRIDHIICINR